MNRATRRFNKARSEQANRKARREIETHAVKLLRELEEEYVKGGYPRDARKYPAAILEKLTVEKRESVREAVEERLKERQ